jgi:hypothetical protein
MLKTVNAITLLREFNTGGHKPILVLADDENKYVVKPCRNPNFDYAIYNEIICNYFLNIWNLPTPEMALVKVDKEITANSINAAGYKRIAYKNYFFGSKYYESALELNSYFTFNKKLDYKKLQSPEKTIQLGLFDIWTENDDRKPTNYNILLNPVKEQFKILAIDNAFTFSTLDYQQLNPNYVCNSLNDNVLYSDFAKGILKKIKPNSKWISHQKDLFYLYTLNCSLQFDEIIQ